jgi:hypothetical protein
MVRTVALRYGLSTITASASVLEEYGMTSRE